MCVLTLALDDWVKTFPPSDVMIWHSFVPALSGKLFLSCPKHAKHPNEPSMLSGSWGIMEHDVCVRDSASMILTRNGHLLIDLMKSFYARLCPAAAQGVWRLPVRVVLEVTRGASGRTALGGVQSRVPFDKRGLQ